MSGAQIWIQAARPKTLGAAIAPVLIGSAMAFADHRFHAGAAIAAMLAAISIQIGTNFCNDYCDFKKGADKDRIGPVRATQAGLVTPQAMKLATFLVFSFSAFCCLYLSARGGWPIIVIGVASILSGIAYTAGPKPLAYVGLGDLFVLIFFGPVAVAGTYYVQALDVTKQAIVAGLAPGFLAVGILIANNLRDIEGDSKVGKRTLAVRFGILFSRIEYTVCIIAGCIVVPLWLLVAVPDRDGFVACFHDARFATVFVIFSAYPPLRRIWTREGTELNPALGQTAKVLLFYSVMFSIGCIV